MVTVVMGVLRGVLRWLAEYLPRPRGSANQPVTASGHRWGLWGDRDRWERTSGWTRGSPRPSNGCGRRRGHRISERKSVVSGKSVSYPVDHGVRLTPKKKT